MLRRLPLPFSLFALLAFLFGSCERKPDPTAVAQKFFEQVGSGRAQEAYESAAFGFKAQQSLKLFEQTAKEMGFTEFASATWEQPEIRNQSQEFGQR